MPCLGFNGELHEGGASWQFLGSGHRVYNPALQRFHSQDSLSPFGVGGLNAYAYCRNDPLNFVDPTGEYMLPLAALMGVGSLALGAAAAVSGMSDDQKNAAVFGAMSVVLGALVLVAARVHVVMDRRLALKPGELRIHRGRKWDKVDVHGGPYYSEVGEGMLNGTEFGKVLKQHGLGSRPVKVMGCGQANGPHSQGQAIANELQQPLKTFHGDLNVRAVTNRPHGKYRSETFLPEYGTARENTAIRNAERSRIVTEWLRRESVR